MACYRSELRSLYFLRDVRLQSSLLVKVEIGDLNTRLIEGHSDLSLLLIDFGTYPLQ